MPQMLMLLVTIAAATGHPVKGGPADVVPFDTDKDGGVIVPVWIDGRGPYRFLLDTGSNLSAVSERLAGEQSLQPVARTALTTVGGVAMRPVVQLGRVSVGTVSRAGLLASVAATAELAILGVGVDGMLGQDFLATYNFTVDYHRKRIVWDELEGAGAWRLPLIPRDGRFVVQLPGALGDEPLEMVPDSGTGSFVLFARDGDQVARQWSEGSVTISGLTGTQRARYSRLRELRVGGMTLRNIPIVVVRRDDGEHEGADGLLPLHLFRRVTFRVSEGYMAVER
ncbi:MAG: aspartyl protease family protein [Vicinamibacterales bacterium]